MLMLKTLLATTAGALIVLAAMLMLLIVTPPVQAATCAKASWYGTESCTNPRCLTANGEVFTSNDLTAAHKTLPFGTRLRVTLGNRSVVVRINDRGPFVAGRALDLSRAAAVRLGMLKAGVAQVCFAITR